MSLLLLLLYAAPAQAAGEENLIRMMCMAAFDTAMIQAGREPAAGMGDFTCDCFLKQLDQGQGIQASQITCKQKAAQKFNF